jgi:hypothetical protein
MPIFFYSERASEGCRALKYNHFSLVIFFSTNNRRLFLFGRKIFGIAVVSTTTPYYTAMVNSQKDNQSKALY